MNPVAASPRTSSLAPPPNVTPCSTTSPGPPRRKPEFAAGVNWFNAFRDFTATGFFTSEIGVEDIGYMGNVPVMNWDGCPTENYTRLGTSKP